MKNCFDRSGLCKNCVLYALYKQYQHILPRLSADTDCHDVCRLLTCHLWSVLLKMPNEKYDQDAYLLIDYVEGGVDNDALLPAMRLCYVAIQSKLLRGLNRASSMEAGVLLKSFQNYLDRYRYCSQATEEELCTAYCAYYAVKFQLMHLAGRYQHVTEEYERRLVSDEMIVRHGRRVKSQYTASQWVGSISKAERVKSRDGAESLMESVRSDGVRHADDYFIMAKYLEHHIQSGTPGEGWREVAGYLESPAPVGEISSSGEAVNQAILYRDLFEAAQKAGSDQAIAGAYLKRAKEIVRIYQLLDQKSKIRKVERDLGKGGKQGKYNIQAQQVNIFEEGLQQPVLYAAFSGTIDQIAKSDIDRLSAVCGEDMREDLRDARDALERGDESGLKKALKKVCQMGGELITNVASEALIAYLRQNGLLP